MPQTFFSLNTGCVCLTHQLRQSRYHVTTQARFKKPVLGLPLVVQWLRLHSQYREPRFDPWSRSYIPHAETKSPYATTKTRCSQNIKNKKNPHQYCFQLTLSWDIYCWNQATMFCRRLYLEAGYRCSAHSLGKVPADTINSHQQVSKRAFGGGGGESAIRFTTFITCFTLLEKWSFKQHTIKSILLFGEGPRNSTIN